MTPTSSPAYRALLRRFITWKLSKANKTAKVQVSRPQLAAK
jgi:hypothetical protein